MSNTQYQRGMEDMRKAGLNPILAYKQGGAAAPTGTKYESQNVTGPAAQAAIATAQSMATTANLEANSAKTIADAHMSQQKARDHRLFGDGYGSGAAITADRLRTGAIRSFDPNKGLKKRRGSRPSNRPRMKIEHMPSYKYNWPKSFQDFKDRLSRPSPGQKTRAQRRNR